VTRRRWRRQKLSWSVSPAVERRFLKALVLNAL
jgi:hypothetical protein